MEVDTEGDPMRMDETQQSTGDSVVTLARDGVLTDAGQQLQRAAQQRARALPLAPADRAPLEWDVSIQRHQGKHASCRGCCVEFGSDEFRFCRSSDSRARASRYLHAACVPGGFHPQDTFTGAAAAQQQAVALVNCYRGTLQEAQTPLTETMLPSIPPGAGDAWWDHLRWEAAFSVTSGTLIDVPPSAKMAYALYKNDVVGQCLEGGSGPDASRPWRKLSFLDSLVLNNHRSEGESQTQSVVRRLQQAADGDWRSLWLEATVPSAKQTTSAVANEVKQAKLVRDLALAGEAGRALKAVRQRMPVCRDPAREGEVQRLFPTGGHAELSAACPGEHKWSQDQADELADMIASRLGKRKRRTAPGRPGGRYEHWHVRCIADG